MVTNTVISKKPDLRVNANGYVIYVQGEQQWTVNSALWDTRHNRGPVRFNTINYYPLLPEAQKALVGINDAFQFRKIITRYRRIGYNLNVMRQSACLVFNPIMVDNYAAFFNCTPVGRASDSMMAST